MLSIGKLVISGLGLLTNGLGKLTKSAENNQERSGWLAIIAGVLGLFGVEPDIVSKVGQMLVTIGQAIQ